MAPFRRWRKPLAQGLLPAALCLALAGCATAPEAPGGGSAAGIVVDQLGYLPGGAKWAAVRAASRPATSFALRDDASGAVVLRGALTPPREWSAAGQSWQLADFSAVRSPGRYRLQVDGQATSLL